MLDLIIPLIIWLVVSIYIIKEEKNSKPHNNFKIIKGFQHVKKEKKREKKVHGWTK